MLAFMVHHYSFSSAEMRSIILDATNSTRARRSVDGR